jgi:hypothetical protein
MLFEQVACQSGGRHDRRLTTYYERVTTTLARLPELVPAGQIEVLGKAIPLFGVPIPVLRPQENKQKGNLLTSA